MFIDALSELETDRLTGDICIIGAGAAGITIAREFLNSTRQVILLESGGFEIDADTQALYEGEVTGPEYFTLDTTRLRYFGGSTNHWGGMVSPLFPTSFEKRPWVPMSGWPFGLELLIPYYRRACDICELSGFDFNTEWAEHTLASERLPLDPAVFDTHLMRYSPPTRFGTRYRQELRDARNISVVLNANVLELLANEAASHLETVKCTTLKGQEFSVSANQFILATGGIENPRILLLSNSQQSDGLGNGNDLVGRYFMEHPQHKLGMVVPTEDDLGWTLYDGERWRRKDGMRAECRLTPSLALQSQEALMNSTIAIWPHYAEWGEDLEQQGRRYLDLVGKYLRDHGVIGQRNYRIAFASEREIDYCGITIASEQAPNSESRVLLSGEKDVFGQNRVTLNWRLTDLDIASLEKTTEILARQVGKAGIGRMKIDIETDNWPAGNHHMGTTRMSVNPKEGVVDPDCRLHGIDNLFIAGSSVFPTAGAVNPTLTIVALAVRLAEHLKERLT